MGTMQHRAAIASVHSYPGARTAAADAVALLRSEARAMAAADAAPTEDPDLWEGLIVGPVPWVVNASESYLFTPDGSKMGWATSDNVHTLRLRFVELMKPWADVVLVEWGELGTRAEAQE